MSSLINHSDPSKTEEMHQKLENFDLFMKDLIDMKNTDVRLPQLFKQKYQTLSREHMDTINEVFSGYLGSLDTFVDKMKRDVKEMKEAAQSAQIAKKKLEKSRSRLFEGVKKTKSFPEVQKLARKQIPEIKTLEEEDLKCRSKIKTLAGEFKKSKRIFKYEKKMTKDRLKEVQLTFPILKELALPKPSDVRLQSAMAKLKWHRDQSVMSYMLHRLPIAIDQSREYA